MVGMTIASCLHCRSPYEPVKPARGPTSPYCSIMCRKARAATKRQRPRKLRGVCNIDDCDTTTHAKGYCSAHYNRLIRVRDYSLEVVRAANLKAFYGLTTEQYDAMVAEQGGVCAICGGINSDRALNVDHDHSCCPGWKSCGKCVRQLLCGRCNTALGLLKDDVTVLQQAIDYLIRHKE